VVLGDETAALSQPTEHSGGPYLEAGTYYLDHRQPHNQPGRIRPEPGSI